VLPGWFSNWQKSCQQEQLASLYNSINNSFRLTAALRPRILSFLPGPAPLFHLPSVKSHQSKCHYFIKRIISLHRCGHLWLPGSLKEYKDRATLKQWLSTISPPGFRVLVQPPPSEGSTPEHVLRYLARYICGGPISNSRLVSDVDGMVTFMARSLEKPAPGEPHQKVEVTIPGAEFVHRWALHILPKFLFKVRHYGQLSNPHRAEYLERCKKLLGVVEAPKDPDPPANDDDSRDPPLDAPIEAKGPRCPKCGRPMKCVEMSYRPSWKVTMAGPDRPAWYSRAERYSDYSRRFTSSNPP